MTRLPPCRPALLTQTDATVEAGSFCNTKNEVSVWGKGGRFALSTVAFSRFVRLAKPRFFQVMADNQTPAEVGRKRCRKAVDRTMQFTEQVLKDLEEVRVMPLYKKASFLKALIIKILLCTNLSGSFELVS